MTGGAFIFHVFLKASQAHTFRMILVGGAVFKMTEFLHNFAQRAPFTLPTWHTLGGSKLTVQVETNLADTLTLLVAATARGIFIFLAGHNVGKSPYCL